MLPFKANYGYKLKILLILRQAKKISKTVKERMEKLIQLYKNLYKSAKLVQDRMKRYLKDQILKREIKSTYLLKILRTSDPAKS